MTSRASWASSTRELLHEEWKEEQELAVEELNVASRSFLERLGRSVGNLTVDGIRTGLYGRVVVTFAPISKGKPPNMSTMSVGDVVRVVPNNGVNGSDQVVGEPPSGIVSKVTENSLDVAFNDKADDSSLQDLEALAPLRIDKLPNDAMHRKQLAVLERVENTAPNHPAYHTTQVLFGESEPLQHSSLPGNRPFAPFNDGLNKPQLEAIDFALRSRDVALIHGPPGTGKTTAVVELIRQATQVYGMKLLVCAPSNIAVDNIVLRLAPWSGAAGTKKQPKAVQPMNIVRVGHPARLLPQVLEHSLDAVIKRADSAEVVNDARKDLQGVLQQLSRPRGSSKASRSKGKASGRVNFGELRREATALRKEIRTREKAAVQQIIRNCNVVLCTNPGASSVAKHLGPDHTFDMVIIDEAAQSIEASCWIPILLGKRVVLAGDHKQLPPTIKSQKAAQGILGTTLFDRIVAMYGDRVTRLLNIQYRMHQLINDWASTAMYDGKLIADPGVASRKLIDLNHVNKTQGHNILEEDLNDGEDEDYPELATLVMIDTAFCGLEEAVEGEDQDLTTMTSTSNSVGSKYNQGEAEIVKKHVQALLAIGLDQTEIAVITPYNGQVHLLRSMCLVEWPRLEVRSVDGFQGREKEAVVLSLVRSNDIGEVGFLADDRRLNVAITRARRHVCVICDSETLSSEPESFLANMVNYFHEHATLISAEMYVDSAGPMNRVPVKKGQKKRQHLRKPRTEPVVVAEDRVVELFAIVKAFLDQSETTELDFEAKIPSSERRIIHQAAEELGIQHESIGTGEERFIRLSKLPSQSKPNKEVVAEKQEDTSGVGHSEDIKDRGQDELGLSSVSLHKDTQGDTLALNEKRGGESEDEDEDEDEAESDDAEAQEALDTPSTIPPKGSAFEIFAATRVPAEYMALVGKGVAAQEAVKLALKNTERAFKAIRAGGQAEEVGILAGQNVPAPALRASSPTTLASPESASAQEPTGPMTEIQRMRAAKAEEYAKQKRESEELKKGKKSKGKGKGKGKGAKSKKGEMLNVSSAFKGGSASTADDDDAFLDEVLSASKKCAFLKCSTSVQTRGVTCSFCKLKFCFKHGQAEEHGCSHDARKQANRAFKADARAPQDGARKLQGFQRSHLRKALDSKISGHVDQRTAKDAKANGEDKSKNKKKTKR